MTAPAKAEHGINRLLDIVVEEVSLVDRAANKHRFLIVKRSNNMDQTTTDATATATDETEDVQDLAAETDDEQTATGAERDATDGAEAAGADSPLGSALAALEGLTEAVEILGTAGGDAATPRLAELAGELKTVSDRLAGLAGAKPAGGEAGGGSGGKDGESQPGAADGDPLASAVASVRATLGRVTAALDTAAKDRTADDAGKDKAAKPGAAGASGSGDGVAAQLEAVATALRTLTDTVKEQQQRLGRIEKRFGLPNSAPSGERPAKPDDEEVGWPLDLNRPFDRESVDKATSFHDL